MKKKFYLVLPNIRSCHNIGAMFRNADAFGVDKIFLVGWTACPPKPQIDKVALGAETWISWEHKKDLEHLLTFLKKKGSFVVGLEQDETSQDMSEWNLNFQNNKSITLVVGNEVSGIAPEILEMCDDVVHIPMHGKKESLNVSVAAGIAMWEVSKRL